MTGPVGDLRRALVLGASGVYGSRLVRLLRAEGTAVVATARDVLRTPPRRGVIARAYDAAGDASPTLPGEKFDAAFVALPPERLALGYAAARAASDVVVLLARAGARPPAAPAAAVLVCGEPCGDGVCGPFRPWLSGDAAAAAARGDSRFRPLDPRDAARAAVAAARARTHGVFRIDGGGSYSAAETAALVAALRAGSPAPPFSPDDEAAADADARAARGFVFRPRFTFADSLASLLAEAAGAPVDPPYWSA